MLMLIVLFYPLTALGKLFSIHKRLYLENNLGQKKDFTLFRI